MVKDKVKYECAHRSTQVPHNPSWISAKKLEPNRNHFLQCRQISKAFSEQIPKKGWAQFFCDIQGFFGNCGPMCSLKHNDVPYSSGGRTIHLHSMIILLAGRYILMYLREHCLIVRGDHSQDPNSSFNPILIQKGCTRNTMFDFGNFVLVV